MSKKNIIIGLVCLLGAGVLIGLGFWVGILGSGADGLSRAGEVVRDELELLKNMNPETIRKYVDFEEMEEYFQGEAVYEDEASSILVQFFDGFDYEILDDSVIGDRAEVKVKLFSIDAESLVKDYYKAAVGYNMLSLMGENSDKETSPVYFSLFLDVLKGGEYGTVAQTVVIDLTKENGRWGIIRSDELKDRMIGDFYTYATTENLFTPSEAIEIHMDNMKDLTIDQFVTYVGFNDIFGVGSDMAEDLDKAFAEQILKTLNYHIISCNEQESKAVINLQVQSLDIEAILSDYAQLLLGYASSSDSLNADSEEQHQKIYSLLQEAIENNEAARVTSVDVNLNQSGLSWSVEMSQEFVDAITGNFMDASETLSLILENGF